MSKRMFGTNEAAVIYAARLCERISWLRCDPEKNAQKIRDEEKLLKQVDEEIEEYREYLRRMGANYDY
jgi:hypothetical protein